VKLIFSSIIISALSFGTANASLVHHGFDATNATVGIDDNFLDASVHSFSAYTEMYRHRDRRGHDDWNHDRRWNKDRCWRHCDDHTPAVPLPVAIILFISGLAFLGLMARRKK